MGESRRHPARSRRGGQGVSFQGFGHRRKLHLYLHKPWDLRVFLRPSPPYERESDREMKLAAVRSGMTEWNGLEQIAAPDNSEICGGRGSAPARRRKLGV